MNQPRRREVERFIHVDSRDFGDLATTQYKISFGLNSHIPDNTANIPIQDYNNVTKIELKSFLSQKPPGEDYVIFKIKNIDGKVDSTSQLGDISTICYFDPTSSPTDKKPIYFGGNTFLFNPPLAKLTKLEIDILKRTTDGEYKTYDINNENYQSFLLKITYIEGNLY